MLKLATPWLAFLLASLALGQEDAGPTQIALEGSVRSIAFEPGGARAWVVLGEPGALVEVDAAAFEVRARRELPGGRSVESLSLAVLPRAVRSAW